MLAGRAGDHPADSGVRDDARGTGHLRLLGEGRVSVSPGPEVLRRLDIGGGTLPSAYGCQNMSIMACGVAVVELARGGWEHVDVLTSCTRSWRR